jgi:hypothetical protein
MTTTFKTAALAFALAAAALTPASAAPYSQLAASAGLTPAEAASMSPTEIAAAFFNRGESIQDAQTVASTAMPDASGPAASNLVLGYRLSARNMPSLREIAAIHANRGVSVADRITVITPLPGSGADRSQLAASAGFGDDGAGRSLTELANAHYNRGVSNADMQTVN